MRSSPTSAAALPLLLAWLACGAAAQDPGPALGAFGFALSSAAPCALQSEYRRGTCAGGKTCFSTVKAACGPFLLRVELTGGLGAPKAARSAALRLAGVRQLYAGKMEYPGVITTSVEVPAALRPRSRPAADGGFPALFLPASAGLAYGVGAEDLVAYAAALTYLYCPAASSLAQVEVFGPVGSSDARLAAVLDSLACAPPAPDKIVKK